MALKNCICDCERKDVSGDRKERGILWRGFIYQQAQPVSPRTSPTNARHSTGPVTVRNDKTQGPF